MKNSCFWSTVALLAIVLCLETVTGTQLYKVNEVGNRPIHGHFCGNHIMEAYDSMCYSGKRKRRSSSMDEKEALSFLHSQTPRSANNRVSRSTDIVEECCTEGCHYEEISEYC
ncbi:hypothetical protein OS493_022716 [Desmophyllum pertusum]|uniref:Insulin-like domain-containing protein n=1 Tax=Desmophyllum pertusum TaxID=174260 RepID=A0A9X0CFW4_9CNID|nr:hypothetical protein OS493_022716 [Desmophyllum pertusum]